MDNLTRNKGIVRRIEDPEAAHGEYLVVFQQSRDGKEIHRATVEPGQSFSRSFMDRFRHFVGYAVQTDPFSHSFSQRYEHYRQGHSFTLGYRLELVIEGAEGAERVQLRLARDPLWQLQQRVERFVGAEVREQEWERIAAEPTMVGSQALAAKKTDHHGVIGSTVATVLDRYAEELGFKLLNLDVECELDEQAVARPVARAKAEAEIANIEEGHRVDVVKEETGAEIKELRARLDAKRTRFAGQVARFEELANTLMTHFDHALGSVAGQIDDVSGLTSAIEELARLHRTISGLVEGEAVGRPVAALGAGQAAAPLALPETDGLSPCADFLGEAVTQVSGLSGDEAERRSWLAYILRVVAAVLDGEKDDGELEQLHEDFEPRYRASIRSLRSDEQRRFFDRLRKPEHLHSRLLGEEG